MRLQIGGWQAISMGGGGNIFSPWCIVSIGRGCGGGYVGVGGDENVGMLRCLSNEGGSVVNNLRRNSGQ